MAELLGTLSRDFCRQIVDGDINLEELEESSLDDVDLLKELQKLPGIGPFSATNMLQLLGRYQNIACDSETVRHMRHHHKMAGCTNSNVKSMTEKVQN